MLKMNFGCQVSWDSVPPAVGFISPECTTREEPLRVRSLSGSFRGLYWQWAREVYSLKIVRQSDFPVRICKLANCDVFEKAGVGVGETRAAVARNPSSEVHAEPVVRLSTRWR